MSSLVKLIDEMLDNLNKKDEKKTSDVGITKYVKIYYGSTMLCMYNKNAPGVIFRKPNWSGEQVQSIIVPACIADLEVQRLKNNEDIVIIKVEPFIVKDSDYEEDLKKLCTKGKPDRFKALIMYGCRKYQVYDFKYEEYATFRNYLLENNISDKNVKIHPIYDKK